MALRVRALMAFMVEINWVVLSKQGERVNYEGRCKLQGGSFSRRKMLGIFVLVDVVMFRETWWHFESFEAFSLSFCWLVSPIRRFLNSADMPLNGTLREQY